MVWCLYKAGRETLGPKHLGNERAEELCAPFLEMSPFSAMNRKTKQNTSSMSHKQVKCRQTRKETVITKSDGMDEQRRCSADGRANHSV